MTEDRSASTTASSISVRITWADVPERVRAEIERRAGGKVVAAESKSGGFSPGLASVLTLDDGSELFVKAVGPEINPHSPDFLRKEVKVAPLLPADAPVSRFRWSFDEGPDGWVALAFDVVPGRMPRTPWEAAELDLVIDAMIRLAESLTPSPVSAAAIGRTDASWKMFNQEKWAAIRDQFPDALDEWSRRHIDRLIDLERQSATLSDGDTLLHIDLRADNVLITDAGVVIVDWPHAQVGAAWIDPLVMAPSVALEGGPDPETFLRRFPAARSADPAALDAFIAMVTAFFLYNGALPDPPGLPTLRAFQRAQGEIARDWLKQRTG
ncbi:MAG: aminoglycoside phosphotransferase family protein [Thermomicrobiales bacterium]|nr:aminoglycoside phosphotransferase family protein [Thermomicrobiales bacterium]